VGTKVEKPPYGFWYYPPEPIARRQFIKRAQRLGITLKEIGEFLKPGDGQCEDVFELANRKHAWIENQIADLK